MRVRNLKNKKTILESSKFVINNPKDYKGKWQGLFKNNNLIHLEIGTGKCQFLIEKAKRYKDINFIGIERNDSVLALGIKNLEEEINNLLFINYDANQIDELFDQEIDTIYLNFSDPWPKTRHEKRRLTSKEFLNKYDNLFKGEKTIIMKTDNRLLFEYSICSLSNYNYKINEISLDLHNSTINDNILTEYEEKFSRNNFRIYMLKAFKK